MGIHSVVLMAVPWNGATYTSVAAMVRPPEKAIHLPSGENPASIRLMLRLERSGWRCPESIFHSWAETTASEGSEIIKLEPSGDQPHKLKHPELTLRLLS